MNRDKRKSKVDERSSASDSVLGGREEGFGSVSFQEHQRLMMPRPQAFNQHVNQGMPHPQAMNNLEEQQRRMLHYHLIMQRMAHPQYTDPRSSSNRMMAPPVYPPGSRFLPTDLGLVRVHLRSKVEKNKSGFITTLDLYKDDPWLLEHVQNDLFPRGEWYYFTPRTRRGSSSLKRSVPGSISGGGGGTWKSTSKKEPIRDKNNKVEGYMQSLVYNKTNNNVNGRIEPTGWNMTEYCLYKDNQDDLVLCHLKGNIKKKGFDVGEVKKKNILPNQVQDQHEEEEAGGANGVEMRTLHEDHGDATTQQQQEYELDDSEIYIDLDELFSGNMEDDVNEEQLQQPDQDRDAEGGSSD